MFTITFIDICAGVGGMRHGLEKAGHKCIGFCEIDQNAVAAYRLLYNTEGEWFSDDVTKIKSNDIPYADMWAFGSPCQDNSIAGKRVGIRGERSGIYFDIINLVKGKKESDKPRRLIMENVKNIMSVNQGIDFLDVLIEMDEAGYDAEWQILNSKAFGVPQNRERCFIVAHLRGHAGGKILPIRETNAKNLIGLIGGSQGNRVYDPSGVSVTINSTGGGMGAKTALYLIDMSVIPRITDTARCLLARDRGISNRMGERSGVLEVSKRFKTKEELHEFLKKGKGFRIRRLTPKECFKLQGMTDEQFDKVSHFSDAQLYKFAGNAVTVNVSFAIGQKLKEMECQQ